MEVPVDNITPSTNTSPDPAVATMAEIEQWFQAIPPVTRAWFVASAATSVLVVSFPRYGFQLTPVLPGHRAAAALLLLEGSRDQGPAMAHTHDVLLLWTDIVRLSLPHILCVSCWSWGRDELTMQDEVLAPARGTLVHEPPR